MNKSDANATVCGAPSRAAPLQLNRRVDYIWRGGGSAGKAHQNPPRAVLHERGCKVAETKHDQHDERFNKVKSVFIIGTRKSEPVTLWNFFFAVGLVKLQFEMVNLDAVRIDLALIDEEK